MDKVLFFTDSHTDAHARIYAGVCERTRSFGWHVAEIEYARTDRSAEDFIRLWRPIGVVVECSNLAEDLNTKAYSSVPAVYVDPSRLPAGETVASVRQDPLSVAQLAFDQPTGRRGKWDEVRLGGIGETDCAIGARILRLSARGGAFLDLGRRVCACA